MRMILPTLLLLTFLGGCSPYVDNFQYAPRPALTEIRANPQQGPPPLSVLASVIGVRRADNKERIPESVQVRLRFENNGPKTVAFEPGTLDLVNGALLKFPPPVTFAPPSITIAPLESAIVEAFFPFPPGHSYEDVDLDSLQLRWQVRIDGQVVGQSAYFRRIYPVRYYYDPYWYGPGYPAFRGVVVIRHRR